MDCVLAAVRSNRAARDNAQYKIMKAILEIAASSPGGRTRIILINDFDADMLFDSQSINPDCGGL